MYLPEAIDERGHGPSAVFSVSTNGSAGKRIMGYFCFASETMCDFSFLKPLFASGKFWSVVLEKDGEDQEVLDTVKERNIVHTGKRRKVN